MGSTLPRVNNDLFIFPHSFTISPWDFVSFNLSLPARSTNDSLPYLFTAFEFDFTFKSKINYYLINLFIVLVYFTYDVDC